jgi:hypothetical protein
MSADDRVKVLKEAEPNTWVALASDESRVVGVGESYQDAVKKAAESGEHDPILIKTPGQWRARVL